MPTNVNYLGYLKYDGKLVNNGYLDARKSAEALLGFDEAVRHFVGKQSAQLRETEYEIPVKVESGSWIALIPDSIGDWIVTAAGFGGAAYAAAAASKMAEHDFKNVGIRTIFHKALQAIQWLIRIGKHLGSLSRRTFKNVKWQNDNREIGIPNDKGDYLFVPKEFFELYENTPPTLLSRVSRIIIEERKMMIVVQNNGMEEKEEITFHERSIFCTDEEDIILPELKDGMSVSIDGVVTRGNGNANSIGFQYNDHILTCYPESGSIVRFKHAMFVKCQIQGVVSRADDQTGQLGPRPKIVFSNLLPLDSTPVTPISGLFDEEK